MTEHSSKAMAARWVALSAPWSLALRCGLLAAVTGIALAAVAAWKYQAAGPRGVLAAGMLEGMALAVECLSPWLGYWVPGLGRSLTTDWEIEAAHMAERCGLFMIIALGESILVTGFTFTGLA